MARSGPVSFGCAVLVSLLASSTALAAADGWSQLRVATGNVAHVAARTVLRDSPRGRAIAWQPKQRDEMFRVLGAREGWVEVTPVGRNGEGLGESWAYAGWTHRQNIKRVYPAQAGGPEQATIDGPAHLRDRPRGKILGDLGHNATAYVYRRRGNWFFVSAVSLAAFSTPSADLHQPRGWIPEGALDRFVMLGRKNEGKALTMLGVPDAGRHPCGTSAEGEVEPEWLLTGDSAFPLAFHCSGELDGDPNLVGLLPKGGEPPVTTRIKPAPSSHQLTFAQTVRHLADALRHAQRH